MQKNLSRVAVHLWCGRLARRRVGIPSLRSGQALPASSGGGETPPRQRAGRPRHLLVSESHDGIDPGGAARGDIDRQAGDPGEEQRNNGKSQWVGGGSVIEKAA